jgi:hypothetical protein
VLPVVQDALDPIDETPIELPFTANEEIFFLILPLSQSGHLTFSVEKPITSASKGFPQSSHTNS